MDGKIEMEKVSRAMLTYLLDELQPKLRTNVKVAIDNFEEYYFKCKPLYTVDDIETLLLGRVDEKGLMAACSLVSWKSSKLKLAAGKALGLLARLLDDKKHNSDLFKQTFLELDKDVLKLMRLDKHLADRSKHMRGNRQAAQWIVNLLKQKGIDFHGTDISISRTSTQGKLKQNRYRLLEKRLANRPGQTDSSVDKVKQILNLKGVMSTLSSKFLCRLGQNELKQKGILKEGAVFGLSLEDLNRNGKLRNGVPVIMIDCCEHLRQNKCAQLEGLFRISGATSEIQQIKKMYDYPDESERKDISDCSPHSVTGALKSFLREMPNPLLQFKNYDKLVSAQRRNDKANLLQIQASLPPFALSTWNYLTDYLAEVEANSANNKMTSHNIAIVFAPNVIKPQVESYEKIARDTPATIGVVQFYISQKCFQTKSTSAGTKENPAITREGREGHEISQNVSTPSPHQLSTTSSSTPQVSGSHHQVPVMNTVSVAQLSSKIHHPKIPSQLPSDLSTRLFSTADSLDGTCLSLPSLPPLSSMFGMDGKTSLGEFEQPKRRISKMMEIGMAESFSICEGARSQPCSRSLPVTPVTEHCENEDKQPPKLQENTNANKTSTEQELAMDTEHETARVIPSSVEGWQCIEFKGCWTELTSGGCYPNFRSWRSNPQYQLCVADGTALKICIELTLLQDNLEGKHVPGEVTDDKDVAIGFYVFANNGPSHQKICVKDKDKTIRSNFVKRKYVKNEVVLDPPKVPFDPSQWTSTTSGSSAQNGTTTVPAHYSLIPSTFASGLERVYSLRIHFPSERKLFVRYVPPMLRWKEHTVRGEWKGDSAGGCRNFKTWNKNPQVQLTWPISEDSTTADSRAFDIVIVLSQPTHNNMQAIGCYVLNRHGKLTSKAAFMIAPEVHCIFQVSQDLAPYVLVPCTFNPGAELNWELSVHTDAPLTVRK